MTVVHSDAKGVSVPSCDAVESAANHTSGPLVVRTVPASFTKSCPDVFVVSPDYAIVARMVNGPRAEADARLFAASAELLRALHELCENAELARFHIGNAEGGDIVSSALWDTIGQARTAIAKATTAAETRSVGTESEARSAPKPPAHTAEGEGL